jgi:DNA-directed RNA polymerase subunit M/transcription elongation factor TFIIS
MATMQRTTDNKFAMVCLKCGKDNVNFEISHKTRTVYDEQVTTTVIKFICNGCDNSWSEEY